MFSFDDGNIFTQASQMSQTTPYRKNFAMSQSPPSYSPRGSESEESPAGATQGAAGSTEVARTLLDDDESEEEPEQPVEQAAAEQAVEDEEEEEEEEEVLEVEEEEEESEEEEAVADECVSVEALAGPEEPQVPAAVTFDQETAVAEVGEQMEGVELSIGVDEAGSADMADDDNLGFVEEALPQEEDPYSAIVEDAEGASLAAGVVEGEAQDIPVDGSLVVEEELVPAISDEFADFMRPVDDGDDDELAQAGYEGTVWDPGTGQVLPPAGEEVQQTLDEMPDAVDGLPQSAADIEGETAEASRDPDEEADIGDDLFFTDTLGGGSVDEAAEDGAVQEESAPAVDISTAVVLSRGPPEAAAKFASVTKAPPLAKSVTKSPAPAKAVTKSPAPTKPIMKSAAPAKAVVKSPAPAKMPALQGVPTKAAPKSQAPPMDNVTFAKGITIPKAPPMPALTTSETDASKVATSTTPTTGPSPLSSSGPSKGYVFMCSRATQKECEHLQLFGSPHGELKRMTQTITVDAKLFLLNFQTMKLMGPFTAFGEPSLNIAPGAYGGKFSAQVAVAPLEEPLMEIWLNQRIPCGPKTPAETASLLKRLQEQGNPCAESTQKAWFGDLGSEPPAKRQKLDAPQPDAGADALEASEPCDAPESLDDMQEADIESLKATALINSGVFSKASPLPRPEGLDASPTGSDAADAEAVMEIEEGEDLLPEGAEADIVPELYDSPIEETAEESAAAALEAEGEDVAGSEFFNALSELPDTNDVVDLLGSPASQVEDGGAVDGTAGDDSVTKNGYVFLCNNNTQHECESLHLLGAPDREFETMELCITPHTQLFLQNFETLRVTGPFMATDAPCRGIVPDAFGRRFNAQVRVAPIEPLLECYVKTRIPGGAKPPEDVIDIMEKLLAGQVSTQQTWNEPIAEPLAKRMRFDQPGAPNGSPKAFSMGAPMGSPKAGTSTTMHPDGRPYNLKLCVVNFANVGATYAGQVLDRSIQRGDRLFDWEGVRRCLKVLTQDQGMQVLGVVFENCKGPDGASKHHRNPPEVRLPEDIRRMCTSIQETPRLTGRNHKCADDEITIKCAYRRNCRFLDNDNYRDWLSGMRDQKCRAWLESCQELLQMRYFFDAELGFFETLDGNMPAGMLLPNT
eukprot:gnl/TRDRNA2_/TRDRNA2_167879_c0_seq5.p1 gnl/TRDRNA2_/TRDRNA2_167879_c0~~gnl/TRDRNA2_/TRDRNA2_167879_c0_seq5.p1  ORF type:complete len:1148 (-),score=292.16 gnl/TRDRNA2_/TRDRNA2_167879_c0_seq5:64-3486(-)